MENDLFFEDGSFNAEEEYLLHRPDEDEEIKKHDKKIEEHLIEE